MGTRCPPALPPLPVKGTELKSRIDAAVRKHPLPPQWVAHTNRAGEVYYYNKTTSTSTWSHPLAAAGTQVLEAAQDCLAAGPSGYATRCNSWAHRWHETACKELAQWRSVAPGLDGTPGYFYKVSAGSGGEVREVTQWEDPRLSLEYTLKFQSGILMQLFSLPPPVIGARGAISAAPTLTSPATSMSLSSGVFAPGQPQQQHTSASQRSSSTPSVRSLSSAMARRLSITGTSGMSGVKRSTDGRIFTVEKMPADHSCGFHGLGVTREEASRLLRKNRLDHEVVDFVASDLAAAVLAGDRATFPPAIQGDTKLWDTLQAYYSAQQDVDSRRRKAKGLLESDSSVPSSTLEMVQRSSSSDDVSALLQALDTEANRCKSISSSKQAAQKAVSLQDEAQALNEARAANVQAEEALRRMCRRQYDAYVEWIGSDMSFWLSFVRGLGSERTGGLLDALAKVCRLTVRVWCESRSRSGADLELVHEVPFGGREVDLWYQSKRGHFDRLVQHSASKLR